jgi:membrane protein YdbS with pleckstrin-like domain
MGRRLVWRDGEENLITVTPVAEGLFRPFLSLVTAVALVQYGAGHYKFVHQHELVLLLILAGPCLLVFVTRTWRWRSHKVRVTNERVIVEGGVARHCRSSIDLADVYASRVHQRVTERLMRRGSVWLETPAGTMDIGRVRQPAALCRLIDLQRVSFRNDAVPLDTIFEYEHPDPHDYSVNPRTYQDSPWRD